MEFHSSTNLALVEDYSERAGAIYFNPEKEYPKHHAEVLKSLGARYNRNLKDGKGWVFSKKSKNLEKIRTYVKNGNQTHEIRLSGQQLYFLEEMELSVDIWYGLGEKIQEKFINRAGLYKRL